MRPRFGRLAALLTVALLGGFAASSSASTILYFSDLSVGTDRMAQALAASPHTVVTAASLVDFNTRITTESYDLANFFEQEEVSDDGTFTNVASFVAAGGSAIVDDWTGNDSHVVATAVRAARGIRS